MLDERDALMADNAALRKLLLRWLQIINRAKKDAATVAALRETLALIEMETRDGSVWGLRDVNEAARIVLEKP